MIERTFDYRIVRRLASWKVRVSREYIYLVEKKGSEILGLWSFEKWQDGIRIHADMTPRCRGKQAIESAKRSFNWIWDNTEFKRIYAGIPAKNKSACQIAYRSGMNNMRYYDVGANNDYHLKNTRWFELQRSGL